MTLRQRDCSLDLYEAEQLLELLFFVVERAEDRDDWFAMRRPVGSGLYAVETIVARARRAVEHPS